MKQKEYHAIMKTLIGRNKRLDSEKIKVLPDKVKNKVVTYLMNNNQMVVKDFITASTRQKLARKGYNTDMTINGYEVLATYWQSIQPIQNGNQ